VTNFYQALGVSQDASGDVIKRAFLQLARQWHPDINPEPSADEEMKALNIAYATLSDPVARARYDKKLKSNSQTLKANQTQGKPMETNNNNNDIMHNNEEIVEIYDNAPESNIPLMKSTPSYMQVGIFVSDGSGSMGDKISPMLTKAGATNKAIREVFTLFKASSKQDWFSFAVVPFGERASVQMGITPCAQVNDNASYDPMIGNGGGTFIGSGLEEANRLAEEFLQQAPKDIPTSVVIVVLSDGACGNPAATKAIAQRIKQNDRIKICAAFFAVKGKADSGVMELLEEIANDPISGCKTVYDAQTLRDFFIASVSAGR
jgi:uncharacterized protein YegL